jgi:NADP-dependent 3-hydroxy acid dehydrogenase YdfG
MSKLITRNTFTRTFHHDTYPALSESLPHHSSKGKTVFITGAGSGIGKATALAFSHAGASYIFIAGRTESSLLSTIAEIKGISPATKVSHFVLDICDSNSVSKAFSTAQTIAAKPLDILVNNAGYISAMETTASSDFDKFWQHFEVNVKGSMLVLRAFLQNSISQGATVINICSGAAILDFVPGLAGYSASKLATLKLMDYMHHEEAARDLRVFNVQPGVVPTEMAKEGKSNAKDTGELPNLR